ncbi:hypothetical protein Goe4_c00232 [Bacillus phage vB_BthP-Goe4]|uniref:G-protein coupled receptors family 1 profile domain-containing protein n=1 Tax=Bacillus phage vB_BthP-Goe4 TaxID=2315470 RepID=A0A3G5AKK7_9CAUD|nr:hypothetical protein H3015_gp19 [Bacillus phage vB_BthP-Goe4]AYV87825.1 hypothetical protein Goe4_c00232 [Bacillus phage vB_BthP-Goe4]
MNFILYVLPYIIVCFIFYILILRSLRS